MREFAADYLRRTRKGMWDDSRAALEALSLADRERVVDVGCGTGELSRILAEACEGQVVGCDADCRLLERAAQYVPVVAADARRLPFVDGAADLVVCQALLINLHDPEAAVREFSRVSGDLVAAIEPNNGAVTVESSVDAESRLAERARRAYLEGIETDVTLGRSVRGIFESAGIDVVATARYDNDRSVEPPYDRDELIDARRKASGADLADRRSIMLDGGLHPEAYDELRTDWREMGRAVVHQMATAEYTRTETVPFYVTVGRVSE